MPELDSGAADPKAQKWQKAIAEALKIEKDWRKSASRIIARYREEDAKEIAGADEKGGSRFNILYSNIAVLKPSIFQQAPRPDVRRRYNPQSGDQQGEIIRVAARKAATALERGLANMLDEHDSEVEILDAVNDMLLPGRGVLRVRYDTTVIAEPIKGPDEQPLLDEATGEPLTTERIVAQDTWPEYVYWGDFLVAPARRWSKKDKPPWIAFRHLMTKERLREEFGARKAREIPLTWQGEKDAESEDRKDRLGEADRAEIWEVWELRTRKIFWLAIGHPRLLDEADDVLNLEDFYPVPRPLYSVRTTDTLVPVAEYKIYVDLARELDTVTERISALTEHLKAAGIYDSGIEGLDQLLEAGDGEMLPAKGFEIFQSGSIEDHILFAPADKIIEVLGQLYLQRDQIKQTIYEVIGISDILRGSSDPNETLGAQRIKTQFGTLRIDERRRDVNRVLRDCLGLMGEIMAEKFEPDILYQMTGVQLDDQALQILRNEGLRGFLVDIETDSTVSPDELAEQESVAKLLSGVTEFISGMQPVVEAGYMTGKQVVEILRFAIRPFRGARNLEEILDEAEREAEQAQAQPEPPDPETAKMQAEAQKAQSDVQLATIQQETEKIKAQADIRKAELANEKATIDLEKARVTASAQARQAEQQTETAQ